MSEALVYLDHAATTPLAPGVLAAMRPHLEGAYGNPSSVHAAGRAARAAVDASRDVLAATLGCLHREIVFTGSGSEADNLALRGVVERFGPDRGRHVVVSAVEHDAVLRTAEHLAASGNAEVTVVPCDAECRVDPGRVAAAVRADTVLVSVMLVNNETGAVQDVAAIAAAVRGRNARTLVHTDAIQAPARIAVSPAALGVDLLSLSAHKLGGPKGVGALWVRDGVSVAPQVTGGGQERTRRSGTENVAGIAGFAAAASFAAAGLEQEAARQEALTAMLETIVLDGVKGAFVAAAGARRAPGFSTFVLPGCRTDVLLAALDGKGVCASGGSACSSGAPTPSHVLLAMGLPSHLATAVLRCTTGRTTTEPEIQRAGEAIVAAANEVRAGLRVPAAV